MPAPGLRAFVPVAGVVARRQLLVITDPIAAVFSLIVSRLELRRIGARGVQANDDRDPFAQVASGGIQEPRLQKVTLTGPGVGANLREESRECQLLPWAAS